MRSSEVVLNQPFGQSLVKDSTTIRQMAKGNEFILQGAVESLIHGIVLGSAGTGEIMIEVERLGG